MDTCLDSLWEPAAEPHRVRRGPFVSQEAWERSRRPKLRARNHRTLPGARPAAEWVYGVAAAWREAGVDVHVDHIVPLNGKRVSGLHVAANLTILPAALNFAKGNRYECR